MPTDVIDGQAKPTFQRRSRATASLGAWSQTPVRSCNDITLASSGGTIDGRPIPGDEHSADSSSRKNRALTSGRMQVRVGRAE